MIIYPTHLPARNLTQKEVLIVSVHALNRRLVQVTNHIPCTPTINMPGLMVVAYMYSHQAISNPTVIVVVQGSRVHVCVIKSNYVHGSTGPPQSALLVK